MEKLVRTEVPCCITGSDEAVVIATKDRHGKPLRTVMSTKSGLVYTDPRPTAEAIRNFYSEDYRKQYKGVATPRGVHVVRAGRLALQRLDEIRRFIPAGASILDAGSGGGEFVYLSQQAGFSAEGIEPNCGYANYSTQEYGIRVFNGFYQDAQLEDASFDCITQFHVLEHLEQPVESLTELACFLKPGGHFVVEVPNVHSMATAPQQKWHVGHLYNFSIPTLTAVGAKAGLKPVSVESPNDGGVIFAVFRKPEEPYQPNLGAILEGSFDMTYRLLSRHTTLKHYLKPMTPVGRMVTKGMRYFHERSIVKSNAGGTRAILDELAGRRIA